MTNKNILAVLAIVILLVGCLTAYGIYVNVSSNSHVDKLAAAQFSRVSGTKAAYRDIIPVLEFPTLYLQSSWMLDIHTKLDGTVTRLYVHPGDQVRTGQLLGEILNDELSSQIMQAEGKISEARANYVKYNNTMNRYLLLVDAGGISKQQLDEAMANQAAGAAMIATAEASRDQLVSRLAGQKIIAPRDGDILKVYTREGAFIRTGESFVMMGDFSVLLVKENMRHETLEKLLPLNSKFKLVLPATHPLRKSYAANYHKENPAKDQSFDLSLDQVSPPLDVAARYRSVLWRIDNTAGVLEPGTYYRAKLYGTESRRVLSVPKRAVAGSENQRIYSVSPDNLLVEGKVLTGIQDDEYIEILEGLKEGDVVVLDGREGLLPGAKVQLSQGLPMENK